MKNYKEKYAPYAIMFVLTIAGALLGAISRNYKGIEDWNSPVMQLFLFDAAIPGIFYGVFFAIGLFFIRHDNVYRLLMFVMLTLLIFIGRLYIKWATKSYATDIIEPALFFIIQYFLVGLLWGVNRNKKMFYLAPFLNYGVVFLLIDLTFTLYKSPATTLMDEIIFNVILYVPLNLGLTYFILPEAEKTNLHAELKS